jgi:hypothetical protein
MAVTVTPTSTPAPVTVAAATSTSWVGQTVALKGGQTQKFCGADGQTTNVACDRDKVTPYELFQIQQESRNLYSLKNQGTQKFCHDLGDKIHCHSDQVGAHERFEIHQQADGTIAILGPKSGNKRLYCADERSRIHCSNDKRKSAGAWEKFAWLSSNNAKVELPFIPEGASVSCNDGSGMIYRYDKGVLRHYPSPAVAVTWNPSWDKNIVNLMDAQCRQAIPKGEPMGPNLPAISEGASVRCGADPAIYRYEAGSLRNYPSPAIAGSWNPAWNQNVVRLSEAQCTFVPKGEPMTMNVSAIPDGASVTCGDNKVYRLDKGTRRRYPSPEIAASWNAAWDRDVIVLTAAQCQSLPEGPPMLINETGVLPASDTTPSPEAASTTTNRWAGQTVALKGGQTQQFCGADAETTNVACDRDAVTPFELFQLEDTGDNRYALKNQGTQKYCHDLGGRIQCHSDQIGEHERFEIHDQGTDQIAILGPKSGRKRLWCSDEATQINCNRAKDVGAWETFSWLLSNDVDVQADPSVEMESTAEDEGEGGLAGGMGAAALTLSDPTTIALAATGTVILLFGLTRF